MDKTLENILDRAREIYMDPAGALAKDVNLTNEGSIAAIRVALIDLFSEEQLVESEDERIRNLIYCLIRDRSDNQKLLEHNGVSIDKALAYLEKQKENPKTVDSIPPFCVSNVKWADTIITRAIVSLSDDVDYNRDEPCKYRREIDDLKKLRDVLCGQKAQKPAEWSKEDEERLDSIIESYKVLLKDYKACHDVDYIPYNSDTVIRNVVDDVNFLKSLRPRPYWKPSEEQMRFLLAVINDPNNAGAESCHLMLQSLYTDLQKPL